jgi:hypothetical protein
VLCGALREQQSVCVRMRVRTVQNDKAKSPEAVGEVMEACAAAVFAAEECLALDRLEEVCLRLTGAGAVRGGVPDGVLTVCRWCARDDRCRLKPASRLRRRRCRRGASRRAYSASPRGCEVSTTTTCVVACKATRVCRATCV